MSHHNTLFCPGPDTVCSGRRGFLQTGLAGFATLSLPGILRLQALNEARAAEGPAGRRSKNAVIMVWQPGGSGKVTGPEISVTRAPARAAACAMAYPCLPEERLAIKRTGSMASCVGPSGAYTTPPPFAMPYAARSSGCIR